MKFADIVVAQFDANGQVTVQDMCAEKSALGHNAISDTSIEGTNDIYGWSGSQFNGKTVFEFQRKLVTNDTIADQPIENANLNAIWAFGFETLHYHGPSNRFQFEVNFFKGTVTPQSSSDVRPYIHGSLMVLSYGFVIPFGIFVARYIKDYHWWFPLHILSQVLALMMIASAFIIAAVMVNTQFSTIHSWLGLTVLSLSLIAPGVGWAADLAFDKDRKSVPIWPDQIHWWIGRLILVMSYVAIIFGVKQVGLESVFQGFVAVLMALHLIIFLFVEIYRKVFSSKGKFPNEKGSLLRDKRTPNG